MSSIITKETLASAGFNSSGGRKVERKNPNKVTFNRHGIPQNLKFNGQNGEMDFKPLDCEDSNSGYYAVDTIIEG